MKSNDELLLQEYEGTYSTIPDFVLKRPSEKVMFIKKELVKNWFNAHTGKKYAMPLNKIASHLNFSRYGNSAQFRFIVASLVIDDLFPIVSCKDGYYKADNKRDIEDNIYTEQKRINGIRRRIAALEKIKIWGQNIGWR